MVVAKVVESCCIHQGDLIGPVKVECAKRANTIYIRDAYRCALHGRCLPEFKGPWKKTQSFESKVYKLCHTRKGDCPDYKMEATITTTWWYGVVAVNDRVNTLLPQTLDSLAKAGFAEPLLFMDGDCEIPWDLAVHQNKEKLGHLANWTRALKLLYKSNPHATYYAMFEDDLLACCNLRLYLEQCSFPEKCFLNLTLHKENLALCKDRQGWYRSNQRGLGAVGLVFRNKTLRTLINCAMFSNWSRGPRRKAIDSLVVTALKKYQYPEYVHNPGLIQHVGTESSMGHRYGLLPGFAGEDFDALTLLEGT